jgi:hypothetical protein
LNPSASCTIANVPSPQLIFLPVCPTFSSIVSTNPISRLIPATIPRWSILCVSYLAWLLIPKLTQYSILSPDSGAECGQQKGMSPITLRGYLADPRQFAKVFVRMVTELTRLGFAVSLPTWSIFVAKF